MCGRQGRWRNKDEASREIRPDGLRGNIWVRVLAVGLEAEPLIVQLRKPIAGFPADHYRVL
jgi:hypothetical protein